MPKRSAGVLVYRHTQAGIEVLLVHPGGPFWAKKDAGSWSLPKGEFTGGEDPLDAAKREFTEETGHPAPSGEYQLLGEFKQSSGKVIHAWAVEGDLDVSEITSNLITLEWPPTSGQMQEFSECDRAEWFNLAEAQQKLVRGQVPIITALAEQLGESTPESTQPTLF